VHNRLTEQVITYNKVRVHGTTLLSWLIVDLDYREGSTIEFVRRSDFEGKRNLTRATNKPQT
jgi:hypothetical protein